MVCDVVQSNISTMNVVGNVGCTICPLWSSYYYELIVDNSNVFFFFFEISVVDLFCNGHVFGKAGLTVLDL